MTEHPNLRPAEFCRQLLRALEAPRGSRESRDRPPPPHAVGLELKRDLLQRAIAADVAPEGFEAWLLAQVLAAPAGGPVRAVCQEIFDEYSLACVDPDFAAWIAAGTPDED